MADSLLTIHDIAVLDKGADFGAVIDETTKWIPEISGRSMVNRESVVLPGVGAARTIEGTSYETLALVELPTVGFRRFNEGTDRTKARYENRIVSTALSNPRWGIDVQLARSSKNNTPEELMGMQSLPHMRSAFHTCGTQFYYGTNDDANKGFPGLIAALNASAMEVDATGTTSAGSSVWGVVFGETAVQWVVGMAGDFNLSDIEIRDLEDADGKKYSGLHQELFVQIGVAVHDWRAVGRIRDLTAESGKTLTDDHIADLIAKFHEQGMNPDALFMTPRSLKQLRDSRTATNATGAPAPFPTEAFGVPIAPTLSLTNTEQTT